ncbi:MAG: DUF3536 domain-containing protein [Kofleriaceae bacterium]
MPRFVCVHGHFYQPPRENPWLEEIEPQPSAAPYVDWNARITAECYRPNAAARIVDGAGEIIDIVDNYSRMSFNVGPTLLSYLEREAPDVHTALVDADRASARRFGGHGSAMAQAYGHLIMPLASDRDRRTQVRWGVADFVHRFGRAPLGMWLPECAVDTASLEALVDGGIEFTILAPHQAARWRPLAGGAWHAGGIDPTRVYRCALPSGRSIDLFFYDGPASRAVAFDRILVDGGRFADRLRGAAGDGGLAHIATDGESYGHHHRFGDMALAWALSSIEREGAAGGDVRLTNYAEYRALHPATWEVEIHEQSAWSCAHGVERWRADCGCNSGGNPGWNQAWRAPLRAALDWLRDRLAAVFVAEGAGLWRDPWAARDGYVDVVLRRDEDAIEAWLEAHATGELPAAERQRALELAEMPRQAMAMYTSCGWFFDDLSGIETVQCLRYAARAIELAERGPAVAMLGEFLDRLAAARSNLPEQGDGRTVWRRHVEPDLVGPVDVVAHVAATALVDGEHVEAGPVTHAFTWDVEFVERLERTAGDARLVAGRVRARSWITEETTELAFAGLHRGGHELLGGVEPYPGSASWHAVTDELGRAFVAGDVDAAAAVISRHIRGPALSIASLVGRGRARAVERLLRGAVAEVEAQLATSYAAVAPLMRWLVAEGLPVPAPLPTVAAAALRGKVLAEVGAASRRSRRCARSPTTPRPSASTSTPPTWPSPPARPARADRPGRARPRGRAGPRDRRARPSRRRGCAARSTCGTRRTPRGTCARATPRAGPRRRRPVTAPPALGSSASTSCATRCGWRRVGSRRAPGQRSASMRSRSARAWRYLASWAPTPPPSAG